MIGARADLGVGAIGVTRIGEEGSADATRLIREIDIESPFSIQIDIDVLGPGKSVTNLMTQFN